MSRGTAALRLLCIGLAAGFAGCVSDGAQSPQEPNGRVPVSAMSADECRAEVARLQARLATETAERQRMTRAAQRREDGLRKQLEAMKSIERGILERDDRIRTEAR